LPCSANSAPLIATSAFAIPARFGIGGMPTSLTGSPTRTDVYDAGVTRTATETWISDDRRSLMRRCGGTWFDALRAVDVSARILGLAIVATAVSAHAGVFVEVVGGVGLPVSNDEWKSMVTYSPTVGARVGVMSEDWGGMLAVAWTPEVCGNGIDGGLGIGEGDVSIHTLRALASGVVRHRVSPSITLSGRAGAGIDIAIGRVDGLQDYGSQSISGSDVGLAFEVGVGIWFDVGAGAAQFGIELGLPIAHHIDRPFYQATNLTFDYTSVDVELLLAVRF
jgi:hypothetical protein